MIQKGRVYVAVGDLLEGAHIVSVWQGVTRVKTKHQNKRSHYLLTPFQTSHTIRFNHNGVDKLDISKLRVSSVKKTEHGETFGVRFSGDEAARVSIFDDSIGNGKTRKMLIISFSFDTLKKLGWLDGDRINLMHIFEKDGSQSDFFVVTKSDKRLGPKLTCKSSTSGGRVRITFPDGAEPENVESHVIGVSEVMFTDCGSLIISRNKNADRSALAASAK